MSDSDDLAIQKALADGNPNFRVDPGRRERELPGAKSLEQRLVEMAAVRSKTDTRLPKQIAMVGGVAVAAVSLFVATVWLPLAFLVAIGGAAGVFALHWGATAGQRRNLKWLDTHAGAIATARGRERKGTLETLDKRSVEDQARLDAAHELDSLETGTDTDRVLAEAKARLARVTTSAEETGSSAAKVGESD